MFPAYNRCGTEVSVPLPQFPSLPPLGCLAYLQTTVPSHYFCLGRGFVEFWGFLWFEDLHTVKFHDDYN